MKDSKGILRICNFACSFSKFFEFIFKHWNRFFFFNCLNFNFWWMHQKLIWNGWWWMACKYFNNVLFSINKEYSYVHSPHYSSSFFLIFFYILYFLSFFFFLFLCMYLYKIFVMKIKKEYGFHATMLLAFFLFFFFFFFFLYPVRFLCG